MIPSRATRATSATVATVALIASTALLSLAILATPLLPAMDLPQHLAMAAELRRLWDGDPATAAELRVNLATHNAGFHLFVATLARWIPLEPAGRLFMALCPAILVTGITLGLREMRLPTWRALLVIPIAMGFVFCWGFANFWMGTALAWLSFAIVVAQLRELTLARSIALLVLSLVLSVNHVLALLGLASVAAAAGLEHLVRAARTPEGWRGRRTIVRETVRIALVGAPLLAGCAWDLHVMSAHTGATPDAYSREPGEWFTPSPLWKLASLGTLCGGLFRTFLDIALAWIVIAIVLGIAVQAYRERAQRTDRSKRDERDELREAREPPERYGPGTRGDEGSSTAASNFVSAAPRTYVLPFVVVALAYLAIPSVFAGTHQVFPRFAQWAVLAALFAIPPVSAESIEPTAPAKPVEPTEPTEPTEPADPADPTDPADPAKPTETSTSIRLAEPTPSAETTRLPALASGIALASALLTAAHLAAYTIEIRGLDEALTAIPDGARLTGVIEEPRTASIRQAALVHVAALHAARKRGGDPFAFARYMGLPVVFQPGHEPMYPEPSWEWDASRYDPSSSVARQFPWILVRTAWAAEPTSNLQMRLFGSTPTSLVARHGAWAVFHLSALEPPPEPR